MAHENIDATIAELGLTVESRFIPWSQSRNKGEKQPSLNWVVTLKRNGRDVISTDYGAGMAHCPAYGAVQYQQGRNLDGQRAIARECETGRAYLGEYSKGGIHIRPDARDVIYSLIMDASVLDSGGFESWVADFGYDPDSRKAETIYRACLDIALKLRSGIGEDGLAKLRDAFEGY